MPTGQKAASTHPEYDKWLPAYIQINDCIEGELTIKGKGEAYLPRPNPIDTSETNYMKYGRYLERGTFIGYLNRVASSLSGLAFVHEPEINIPPGLEASGFVEDVDGQGTNLIQLAKELTFQTLCFGRCGIWVDYTETDPSLELTVEQMAELNPRPYFVFAGAQDITQWYLADREVRLVILKHVIEELDEYSVQQINRYRILQLGEGGYNVVIYNDYGRDVISSSVPTNFQGMPWRHIPFTLIGAQNNTFKVDTPPMLPVSSLNIGHYRNSCDAEWSSFNSGQSQYYITGVDNADIEAMKKASETIFRGASNVWMLGTDASAGVLQSTPNMMPKELMENKVQEIERLSVQLASTGTIRTASEVLTESLVRNSVLVNSIENVSQGVEKALRDACEFTGDNPDSVVFRLVTDLQEISEQAQDVVREAVSGAESEAA